MLDDKFQFFFPIEKAGVAERNGKRYVYGVASTEDLDLDEEVVAASGLKKSRDYFLKNGRSVRLQPQPFRLQPPQALTPHDGR